MLHNRWQSILGSRCTPNVRNEESTGYAFPMLLQMLFYSRYTWGFCLHEVVTRSCSAGISWRQDTPCCWSPSCLWRCQDRRSQQHSYSQKTGPRVPSLSSLTMLPRHLPSVGLLRKHTRALFFFTEAYGVKNYENIQACNMCLLITSLEWGVDADNILGKELIEEFGH